MNFLLLGIFIAILFYLILPGIGMLSVSDRWRRFRRAILGAGFCPIYPAENLSAKRYRFFGELEAIEGQDIVWLNDGKRRVRVKLKNCPIYNLPGGSFQTGESLIRYSRWQQVGSLSEGVGFFVVGKVGSGEEVPVFEDVEDDNLTVVMHDVKPECFLSQAISLGRKKNPYWNSTTAPSLLLGMLIELLVLVTAIQGLINRNQFLFLTTLVLLPGIILAPPGIFFFFSYRKFWRLGHRYHIEADLLSLVLRYSHLPDGRAYEGREVDEIPANEDEAGRDGFLLRKVMAGDDDHFWCYAAKDSSDPFAESVYINGRPTY